MRFILSYGPRPDLIRTYYVLPNIYISITLYLWWLSSDLGSLVLTYPILTRLALIKLDLNWLVLTPI